MGESILYYSCIILKSQCVDTSGLVKDHLDNVIMQMTGFRRKCLILSLLWKKENSGQCFFLTVVSLVAGHPFVLSPSEGSCLLDCTAAAVKCGQR